VNEKGKKKFYEIDYWSTLRGRTIKLFKGVINIAVLYAIVLVTDTHFHPFPVLESKARSLPIEWTYMR
jgi:hypothetical protein